MALREDAFKILFRIINEGGYANLLIDQFLSTQLMDDRDKSLLVRMVYGSLQYYYQLSYEITLLPIKQKLTPKLHTFFVFGLFQLRHLDRVPSYAILNEMVNLAKSVFSLQTSKFVNAMLHYAQDHPIDLSLAPKHVQLSHPAWLVHMWETQYGKEVAEKTCQADLEIAPQAVRVNRMRVSPEDLLKNPIYEKGRLADSSLIYRGLGSVTTTPEYREGYISIQDESSQKVAELLNPQPYETILDMCAAPGSKSSHLAELMNDKGRIVAIDLHPHRVSLIREGQKRLRLQSIEPVVGDATKIHLMFSTPIFDRILLDAPCSGLGVIRHKPDVLVHSKQDQIDGIIDLQRKLLISAFGVLKPGGTLVYSTCTLNKKENQNQISQFISQFPSMKLIFENQVMNFDFGSDAFYMALLKKEEEK